MMGTFNDDRMVAITMAIPNPRPTLGALSAFSNGENSPKVDE